MCERDEMWFSLLGIQIGREYFIVIIQIGYGLYLILTCVWVCIIWIGVVLASVTVTWLAASSIVTISPFVVVVVSVDVDWFGDTLVAVICALGVIVTKFRCKANCAAISSNFPFRRSKKFFIDFFFVFVSVFNFFFFFIFLSILLICDSDESIKRGQRRCCTN